jgi:hypothetical protein
MLYAETGIPGSGCGWNPPRHFIQSAEIGAHAGETVFLPAP